MTQIVTPDTTVSNSWWNKFYNFSSFGFFHSPLLIVFLNYFLIDLCYTLYYSVSSWCHDYWNIWGSLYTDEKTLKWIRSWWIKSFYYYVSSNVMSLNFSLIKLRKTRLYYLSSFLSAWITVLLVSFLSSCWSFFSCSL